MQPLEPHNINVVLTAFYEAMHPQEGQEHVALPPSVLVLRGDGENRHLEVVRKTDLTFWEKVKAYFGYGDAALNNVSDFISAHQAEIRANDLNIKSALEILSTKITHRNEASRFLDTRQVPAFTTPIALNQNQYGSGIDTTVNDHPQEETAEIHANHQILDYVHIYPERGLLVLGDGTGHATHAKSKYAHHQAAWAASEAILEAMPHPEFPISHLATPWREALNRMRQTFEDQAYETTLIVAQILQGVDGEKYLFYIAIGDSTLYLVRADGTHERLLNRPQQQDSGITSGANRASAGGQILQPGDKIVAVTDGITDFMSDDYLVSVIQEAATTPQNLLGKLHHRIINHEAQGGEKQHNGNDRNNSDDIGVGMMIVPA